MYSTPPWGQLMYSYYSLGIVFVLILPWGQFYSYSPGDCLVLILLGIIYVLKLPWRSFLYSTSPLSPLGLFMYSYSPGDSLYTPLLPGERYVLHLLSWGQFSTHTPLGIVLYSTPPWEQFMYSYYSGDSLCTHSVLQLNYIKMYLTELLRMFSLLAPERFHPSLLK